MTTTVEEKRGTHTPGPWEQLDYAVCVAFDSDHCIMYKPNRTPRAVKAPEYIANARLIASAPEMHRLLKRIANDDLGLVENAVECAMDAREILAKVEGGGA